MSKDRDGSARCKAACSGIRHSEGVAMSPPVYVSFQLAGDNCRQSPSHPSAVIERSPSEPPELTLAHHRRGHRET